MSCTIWEEAEIKKADLTVLDVAAAIIAKVDVMPESTDYLCGGNKNKSTTKIIPFQFKVEMFEHVTSQID